MKRILLALFALVLVFCGPVDASVIDSIVGQISQSDYQGYVQTLESFGKMGPGDLIGTRYYSYAGNDQAESYIFNQFSSFGLNVVEDEFTYNGTQKNVVATLPGIKIPNNIYIVGAHYDSTSSTPADAPGADDNASGVAAVLEIASVLANYSFDATIQFIAFDAEEPWPGLHGSSSYATDAKARGDRILGMLNFDMIAYRGGDDSENEDVEVYGDPWLRNIMIGNITKYTSLPYEAHGPLGSGSDQVPFSSTNYPGSSSLLIIEDSPGEIWGGSNLYYHTSGDTSNHLDYAFATGITKAGAATIADLATVPVPASLYLLFTGLFALAGIRRKSGQH